MTWRVSEIWDSVNGLNVTFCCCCDGSWWLVKRRLGEGFMRGDTLMSVHHEWQFNERSLEKGNTFSIWHSDSWNETIWGLYLTWSWIISYSSKQLHLITILTCQLSHITQSHHPTNNQTSSSRQPPCPHFPGRGRKRAHEVSCRPKSNLQGLWQHRIDRKRGDWISLHCLWNG